MKIKSTDKIDLGSNISTLIKSKKIKKADLIRQMQLDGIPITKQRLYKLEHNQANITADELSLLAHILECDISEFFIESK